MDNFTTSITLVKTHSTFMPAYDSFPDLPQVLASFPFTEKMENFTPLPVIMNTTWSPIYDPIEEAMQYLAYRIGIGLHIYFLPILLPVGFVFNILSLIVMLQPSNRKISFCIYLSALAITDNVVLYSAGHYWISSVLVKEMTHNECKAMAGLFQMFSVCSTYLIVAVTLDRFLATCFPHHTQRWRTPRMAYKAIAAVIIFGIVCNIPMIRTSAMVDDYTCAVLGVEIGFGQTFAVSSMILFTLIPFTVILTLNIVISRSIQKRERSMAQRHAIHPRTTSIGSQESRSRTELTSSQSSTDSDANTTQNENMDMQHDSLEVQGAANPSCFFSAEFSMDRKSGPIHNILKRIRLTRTNSTIETGSLDRQLAKMLLTVSFTFLILTLPQYIRYIVFSFLDFKNSGASRYAAYVLVMNITNKLIIINSAMNFVLYCISGRRFRKHLRKMIERKKCCIKTSIITGEPIP